MAKRKYVKYCTKEKLDKINPDNIKIYDKYLKSSIIKNRDMKDTTYKVYQSYMKHFLVYMMEEWENVGLYDEEFMDNAVDIMEGFIAFCQDTLGNNKKVINTKISTVSSFFLWSLKRGLVDKHPFDKKLERMKGADEEKLISHYFLTEEEMMKVKRALASDNKYDIQDEILWGIAIYSANRVAALARLSLEKLDLEKNMFVEIREKRGKLVDVIFDDKIKNLIEEWLEERKELDNLSLDSFFITKRKDGYVPMTVSTMQRKFQKYGTVLGIVDFHPHCARKSSLNNIVEQTGDITLAQQIGNHNDLSTTSKFYTKPKSKAEIMDKIKQMRGE